MTGPRLTFGDREKPSMGESVQLTETQAVPRNGSVMGFCMECAMRHHDYREMLWHETGDDHFSETPFPRAWIDGRQYMLLSPAWDASGDVHRVQQKGAEYLRAHEMNYPAASSGALRTKDR